MSRLGHVAGCQALGEEELDGDSFSIDGGWVLSVWSAFAKTPQWVYGVQSSTATSVSQWTATF